MRKSRTKEECSSPNNDNWMTSNDICDPALDITFNDQFRERTGGNTIDPALFPQYFSTSTSDGQPVDDSDVRF